MNLSLNKNTNLLEDVNTISMLLPVEICPLSKDEEHYEGISHSPPVENLVVVKVSDKS